MFTFKRSRSILAGFALALVLFPTLRGNDACGQSNPTINDLKLKKTSAPAGQYTFRHNDDGILKGYASGNTQTSAWDANTGIAEMLELKVGSEKRRIFGETGRIAIDGNLRTTGFIGAGLAPTQAFETMSNNPKLRLRNSNDGGFGAGAKSWAIGYQTDKFGVYDNGASHATTYSPRLTWEPVSGTFYPRFTGSSNTGTGLMVDGALVMSGSNVGALGSSVIVPNEGKFIARDGSLATKAQLDVTGLTLAAGGNIAMANGSLNIATGGIAVSAGNIHALAGQVKAGNNYISPTGVQVPNGGIDVALGNLVLSSGNINVGHGNLNLFDGGAAMDWLTVQNPAKARLNFSNDWDEGTMTGTLWQWNLGDYGAGVLTLANAGSTGVAGPVTDWNIANGKMTHYAELQTKDLTVFGEGGDHVINFGNLGNYLAVNDNFVATLSTNMPFTATSVGAGTYTGSGQYLTALNASNLGSGTVPDARLSTNIPKLNGLINTFTGEIQASNLVGTSAQIGGSFFNSSSVDLVPDTITLGAGYTSSGFAGLHVMDNGANDWYFGFDPTSGVWTADNGSGGIQAGSFTLGYMGSDTAQMYYDGGGNLSISDTLSGSPNFSVGSGRMTMGGVVKGQRALANGTFTLSTTDYYMQLSCNSANTLINFPAGAPVGTEFYGSIINGHASNTISFDSGSDYIHAPGFYSQSAYALPNSTAHRWVRANKISSNTWSIDTGLSN